MFRAILTVSFMATTAMLHADEDSELRAFAAATGSTYVPKDKNGKDQTTPRLELHDSVKDAELVKLAAIKPIALKSLQMKSCDKITPKGFATLGVMPALTHLTFRHQFDDDFFAKLPKQVPNLEELWVEGSLAKAPGPTPVGVAKLAACTKLKTLTFFSIGFNDEIWAALAKIPTLEEVVIAFGDVGDVKGVGIKQLAACKRFVKLTFLVTPLSEQGFREISELSSLTHLTFEETGLQDRNVAKLAALKELTHLNIEKEKLTDAALKPVAAMPKLTYLMLTKIAVTDLGMVNLTGAKSLREVRLNFTRVTPAGIERLKRLLPEADIQKSK